MRLDSQPPSAHRTLRVAVFGGTGVLGTPLLAELAKRGHELVVFSRNARAATARQEQSRLVTWTPQALGTWSSELDGSDVVVHLARSPLPRRWTDLAERELRVTRLEMLHTVLRAVERAPRKPGLFVCGSSHDFYGNQPGTEPQHEHAGPGQDALARLYRDVESDAQRLLTLGIRVVLARVGAVFGQGAPVPRGLGDVVADPNGPLSWVSLADASAMLRELVESRDVNGPVNLTAPQPTSAERVLEHLRRAGMARSSHAPPLRGASSPGESAERWLQPHWAYPGVFSSRGFRWSSPTLEATMAYLTVARDTSPPGRAS